MAYATIVKPSEWAVAPNLLDYESARGELAGLPDGHGLNIAYEAVDRYAEGALGDHLALRWAARCATSATATCTR